MRYKLQGLWRSQAFVSGLVLLFLVFGAACSSCQVARSSGDELKSAEPSRAKGAPATANRSGLPFCPQTNRPAKQESHKTTEHHHKVTLAWIAASIDPRPGGDVAGYCIYRSATQYAAKHDPLCPVCERVNSVPVKGLTCVDNDVEDTAIYYYVVTAINGSASISSPSNEATAPVRDQHNSEPLSSPPPPSCRDVATK